MKKSILITGGAGFIGSHTVRHFVQKYPDYLIVNFDKLSYAGNMENLADVDARPNYLFIKGDLNDSELLRSVFKKHQISHIIHLAAESHVDRSILGPMEFVFSNIVGTVNLLNIARESWGKELAGKLFYHISTDEVYGTLGDSGCFTESTAYDPRSPYSASKASSDHMVRAYFHTYNFPVVISNCSNNYGPNQFPEKLIPLAINNILSNKPIPVYGKGLNVRDWLYVIDHVNAMDHIFHKGMIGETYNIGGNNEWKNIDLIRLLCSIMDEKLGKPDGTSQQLITFVQDRAGHDLRYAIDSSKIKKELGWTPSVDFKTGLSKTVDWYFQNQKWLKNVISGDYLKYYETQYNKQ
jgi:dTDP-glucose 4,6-dehydratase